MVELFRSITFRDEKRITMAEITLTVNHKVGLHARPAAVFVQTAKQYPCAIKIIHGDRSANAKSILGVLGLGVNMGSVITISAEGERSEQAVVALKELIDNNFGGVE
jgi:phosphocarrier protein HPr